MACIYTDTRYRKAVQVKPDIVSFLRSVVTFYKDRQVLGNYYRFFVQLLVLGLPKYCPTLLTFSDSNDDANDGHRGQSHRLLDELHELLVQSLTSSPTAVELKDMFRNVLVMLRPFWQFGFISSMFIYRNT